MAKPATVYDAYLAHGPRAYYARFGDEYQNPHEPVVAELVKTVANDWPLDVSRVLDLAAGSGEVTLALRALAGHIEAIDPYTAKAYERRTGLPCESMTFEQIAAGGLRGRRFSIVVCSFAMHLAEPSRLPTLCWELAQVAGQLLILTPHKRPRIESGWGWTQTHETVYQRVRARLYASQAVVTGS